MKTANAALLIAAGILLLWVVTSGRLQNLAASWQALLGAGSSGSSSSIGGSSASSPSSISLPNSSVGTWGSSTSTSSLDELPSLEELSNLQGTYPEMYPSLSGVPTFDQSGLG